MLLILSGPALASQYSLIYGYKIEGDLPDKIELVKNNLGVEYGISFIEDDKRSTLGSGHAIIQTCGETKHAAISQSDIIPIEPFDLIEDCDRPSYLRVYIKNKHATYIIGGQK